MNRREFVKALAGIPLLGLLVKQMGEFKLAGYPDLVSYISDCQKTDYGKLIFWDPYTDKGDDANDGKRPETPVATLSAAIDLAEEGPPGGTVITFCESQDGPRLIVKQEEYMG